MATERKNIQTIYSFCRSLVNSINERIKNGEKIEDSELDPITESFEDVIDFTRAYLINAHDALYGTILMGMEIEIDYKVRAIVDLQSNNLVFKLKVNPLFIGNLTISQYVTLVVGEIVRMIYEHPTAFASKNSDKDQKQHDLLEDASSAAVSTLLSRDIKLSKDGRKNPLSIPENFYTTSDVVYETDMRAKEEEGIDYYYEFLKKFRKRTSPNSNGNGNGNNSGQNSPDMNGSGSDSDGDGDNSNNPASPNNSNGQNKHDWEKHDAEKISEQIKSLVSDAYNSMSSESRGNIPSEIISQIQKLLAKPEISWKALLRKFIGTIPFPYRKVRKRLNRRQPERADLCGRLPKRKVRIVCVIDTSGSMSDSDIGYCMNEVFHIAKANETEITVIECDAQVNRVYIAKKPSDVQPKVCGRGGTCFTPAIEYINKEGKYRDALMVYFTDGYGEYEIPKPRTYRNMWVVLHDVKHLSVKNPYGEVKSLSMDGDYKKFKRGY